MENKNYFIKEGYRPNMVQATFDTNENELFWNNNRIKSAENLQYYVYYISNKLISKNRFDKVLDIGCGPPVKIKKMFNLQVVELTMIDQPSIEKMVKKILPSARFIGLNLEHIDIELNKRFDIIICSDVIEHLIDPDKCLSFIRHHLSDNGFAVLSTPERDFRRGINCCSCDKKEHVREWNHSELAAYIIDRGFKINNHFLLPQMRIHPFEYLISRIIIKFFKYPKWCSCQMVICSK